MRATSAAVPDSSWVKFSPTPGPSYRKELPHDAPKSALAPGMMAATR